MKAADSIDQTIAQGRALARIVEALKGIISINLVGQTPAKLLVDIYERQLQSMAQTAPPLVAEAILWEKVLAKSQRRCCVCHQFAGQDINVHHVDPEVKDAPKTLEEAIVLCLRCHAEAVYSSSEQLVGNRYSSQELCKHRDLWWAWCEKHADAAIPDIPSEGSGHFYTPFFPLGDDSIPDPGPLPPTSRLPLRRNALFTGRTELLKALARALLPQSGDSPSPVLVTQTVQEMEGVGKTQLAVEFAYRYGRFFHGVHWLNGAQPETMSTEIAVCGEEMDLPHWPEKRFDQVARTLDEWQREGVHLVILDNVGDVDTAREWLNRLTGGPIRLLLTARRSDWPADLGLNLLSLDVFTLEESQVFLRQLLPQQRAADADLERLAERLGRLPLALELAGHYLTGHPHLSVTDYLDKLETIWERPSLAGWRQDLVNHTGHDLDLAAAFAVSWEAVADENTRRVFLLASHCAPDQPIPCKVLEEAAELKTETCEESLAILTSLDLLHTEDAGPIIRPLLARYAHTLVKVDSVLPALAGALANLACEANKQMDWTGNLSDFVLLLPHVRAVIERTVKEDLETVMGAVVGTLWNSLGYYLDRIEDYSGARVAFERALALWQVAYGRINPQVAIAHSNLGDSLRALGDQSGALAAFERVLAIDEAIYGPDHLDVAEDLNNMGSVLQDMGDLRGAWSAYACALAILEHVMGTDHLDVATQSNKLGMVLQELGDPTEARMAFEQASRIFGKLLPAGHPQIRAVRKNLERLATTD